MSQEIEAFLFSYLSSDPQLAPYLGSGENIRVHPTFTPSEIATYPRATYDILSEYTVDNLKGVEGNYLYGNFALDLWGKGQQDYDSIRALADLIRGNPPTTQKLHLFRGSLAALPNVFMENCRIIDYAADNAQPPFDASNEPFYNVQFVFDFFLKVLS